MSNDRLVFGLALAGLIIVPGLASAFINSLGYPTLGSLTWMFGYGFGVLTVWYVWLRPLDIEGPGSRRPDESDTDR